MNTLIEKLPQEPPFRFLSAIDEYKKGEYIKGRLYINSLPIEVRNTSGFFLTSFILEGLAQLGVIFIQLETKPLEYGEFPLLGLMNFTNINTVSWEQTDIELMIESTKIHENQAFLKGIATADSKLLCNGYLGVAKTKMEWE